MNKTLILDELKQIALREIHTHPGCEDVSAVGISPVTDEVAERNLVCPSRKQRSVDPKPQAALRLTLQHKLRHEDNLLTG
jgi:hypothetical protein